MQALEDHYLKPEGRPPIFIPKDTNVGVDIYGLHTNPDLWDNPLQWDHQRWIKGSPTYQKQKHPVQFNGFSVGPRSCIGQSTPPTLQGCHPSSPPRLSADISPVGCVCARAGSQFALMEVSLTALPLCCDLSTLPVCLCCCVAHLCLSHLFLSLLQSRAIAALLVRELDMEMKEGEKWEVYTQRLTLEPAFGIQVKVSRNPLRQGKANAETMGEETKES